QHRHRPAPFVQPQRIESVHRLDQVTSLRVLSVEGNMLTLSATLLPMGAVPFIRQKMIHRSEQEGAKPAFLTANLLERFTREQLRKEPLRQILRFLRPATLTAHVNVKRIPIGPAKLLQC